MKIDISIVLTKENKSIDKSIQFCKKKGIKCEIIPVDTVAKGEYLFYADPDTYYNDIYLYYAYICLEFGNSDCDAFRSHHIVNYNIKEDTFGVIYNKYLFIRTNCKSINKYYEEYNIMPGCSKIIRPKILEDLTVPNEDILDDYRNFFEEL